MENPVSSSATQQTDKDARSTCEAIREEPALTRQQVETQLEQFRQQVKALDLALESNEAQIEELRTMRTALCGERVKVNDVAEGLERVLEYLP